MVDRAAAVRDHIAAEHGKLGKTRTSVTERDSYRAGDEAGRRARLSSDPGVAARSSRPVLHS